MRLSAKSYLLLAGVVALVIGTWFIWGKQHSTDQSTPARPAQAVKTALAIQQSMPITVFANGYVTSLNTVDVRPQVQSVVQAVHVREGQDVRAGELLFTLDHRSAVSNVAKAQAQLSSSQFDLKEAENTLQRNKELLAQKFVSQSLVDTARAKADTLRSSVEAARAALQDAQVTLSYHTIRASIGGRIGAISVYQGSLVQPTGTPMVNIAQINPIAVSFAVPERELPFIVASYPNLKAPVQATLSDKSTLQGQLIFIDNTADIQSGTIKMKAQFANANRQLWPGTYINIALVTRQLDNAVTVPAQAIVTGPANKFVYVVKDGQAQAHDIEVLAIAQGHAAVTGIHAQDAIVIEGMQNLHPGSLVQEMPLEKPALPNTPAAPAAQQVKHST